MYQSPPSYYASAAPAPVMMVPPVTNDNIDPQFRCPAGNAHFYVDEFTPCGICWAACCFPIGILCCYSMRERKCAKCGQIQPLP